MEADASSVVIAALVAGLLAGYGIAMPVGAVATYLVALTARTSLKIGVCAAFGVATADGVYALIAVVGGTPLVQVVEPIAVPLRWVSVAVLIALAIRTGVSAVRQRLAPQTDVTSMSPARAYFGLLGITILSPMTVVYFTALVLGSRATTTDGAVFVLAAFAASASWQVFLACGGAFLGRVLTGRRGRLLTGLASSLVITVLAVRLILP